MTDERRPGPKVHAMSYMQKIALERSESTA